MNAEFLRVKKFLKKKFPKRIQMFNNLNVFNDKMHNIYDEGRIIVDYCETYNYIEVFGLTKDEFETLKQEIGR